MLKYIFGGIAFLALAAGGYYFLHIRATEAIVPPTQTETPQPVVMATSTYASSTYSVVYPTDYIKNDSYTYQGFAPKKFIYGAQFTVPESMATGTNLALSSGVSIEQLPRAQSCTGDIFAVTDAKATEVTENGITYSVATSTVESPGAITEETIYALRGTKPCTALRYSFMLYDTSPFASSTPREFDRMAITEAFDSIRLSLKIAQ